VLAHVYNMVNFSISTGDQIILWSVGHWFPLSKNSKVIACKILELVLTLAFHTLITVWIMKICLVATCTWYIIAYISSIIPMCRAEGFNICSWQPCETQRAPTGYHTLQWSAVKPVISIDTPKYSSWSGGQG